MVNFLCRYREVKFNSRKKRLSLLIGITISSMSAGSYAQSLTVDNNEVLAINTSENYNDIYVLDGMINIENGAILQLSNFLNVANGGLGTDAYNGTVNISGGAKVFLGDADRSGINIGSGENSVGAINLAGKGSYLEFYSGIEIGFDKGNGTLNVTDGAVVESSHTSFDGTTGHTILNRHGFNRHLGVI